MSDDYRDPVDDYDDMGLFAEEHWQEFEPLFEDSTPESKKRAWDDAEAYYVTHHKSDGSGSSGGCYIATCVYGSYDCPEVWTLRRFRDHTLAGSWYGRAFIELYYAISPTIVKAFGKSSWFQKLWRPGLDRLVRRLHEKGIDDTPYTDRNWKL